MTPIADPAKRFRPHNLFYGWYIVAAGALSISIVGTTTVGFSLFVIPLRDELGWSVTTISIGYSIRSFEQGLLSPFTGYFLDRFGPRRMAMIGACTVAFGLALFSQIQEVWQYYLVSLTVAFGQSLGAGGTPFTLAVMQWFSRKRGRAAGFMNLGNGSTYLWVPLIAILLGAFGWRHTLLILSGIVLILGLPLAMVLRGGPERYGYLPDGDSPAPDEPSASNEAPANAPEPIAGMSVREALGTRAFYFLMLAAAASGATFNAWNVHLVPHLTNEGFSTKTASTIVAGVGLFGLGTRVAIGWFGDRLGRRNIYMVAFAFLGLAYTIFAFLRPDRLWLLPLFFVTITTGIAGFSVHGQTVLADYFGTRRFGTIRGLNGTLRMPFGIGLPILAGWLFDHYGNYHLAFVLIAATASTGLLWVLLAGRPDGLARSADRDASVLKP